MERPRIVMIGAGNVASHIAPALDEVADVVQVVARSDESARSLSRKLRNATPLTDISRITTDADYYIISVSDDSIATVAALMPDVAGIVAHTSGSVGIEALFRVPNAVASARKTAVNGRRCGVFYPLQTFSKDREVDIREVPIFIEGSDDSTCERLEKLAAGISSKVSTADSAQRAVLHIAAVFGCNFFNHMLHISSTILEKEGYTLEVLKPLLEETLRKALTNGPFASQTGPAARGDRKVMEKHLSRLKGAPHEIYRVVSEAIYSAHQTPLDSPD